MHAAADERVAPRVGAWIETGDPTDGQLSPPAWGRGLKQRRQRLGFHDVAPRVGAWIETRFGHWSSPGVTSPPAWGRGLKHPGSAACQLSFHWNGRPPRGGVD